MGEEFYKFILIEFILIEFILIKFIFKRIKRVIWGTR